MRVMTDSEFANYFDSLTIWQIQASIRQWKDMGDVISAYVHSADIDAKPGTSIYLALMEDHKRLKALYEPPKTP